MPISELSTCVTDLILQELTIDDLVILSEGQGSGW